MRKLAQSTLFAAGIAVTQLNCIPEVDPRYKLFDTALMDRLHVPISRIRE